MSTLEEDLDRHISELAEHVQAKDAVKAARSLLGASVELTGAFGVVVVTMGGMGVLGAFLGPFGLALPAPALVAATNGALNVYNDLSTEQRRNARIVIAYLRRTMTGV